MKIAAPSAQILVVYQRATVHSAVLQLDEI